MRDATLTRCLIELASTAVEALFRSGEVHILGVLDEHDIADIRCDLADAVQSLAEYREYRRQCYDLQ